MSNRQSMNLTKLPPPTLIADGIKPITPGTVTADTPLENLNLSWHEHDLPERIRTKHVHRLHPYLGKYIPQLVEVFLRKYFVAGQTVLDPFAGSGTTLIQANELGINAIGYDISAFNTLLIQAKTKIYDLKSVKNEILNILSRLKTVSDDSINQLELWSVNNNSNIDTTSTSDYLNKWFAPCALSELLSYQKLIQEYSNQEVLKIILSRSARSARLTTHFDLDFPKKPQTEPYWCYKHGRECVPTTTAFQFLKRYSLDTIQRLEEFSQHRTNASIIIKHEDSRKADIPKVDGLITSPPYVGLINYHEQHRYAYELLGLEDRSQFEIGSAKRGISQLAQREYQESMILVFKRACESIISGGYLIIIAGDKYNLYEEITQSCGVEVEAVLNRHVNRRTGRRSSEFYESIFICRKP